MSVFIADFAMVVECENSVIRPQFYDFSFRAAIHYSTHTSLMSMIFHPVVPDYSYGHYKEAVFSSRNSSALIPRMKLFAACMVFINVTEESHLTFALRMIFTLDRLSAMTNDLSLLVFQWVVNHAIHFRGLSFPLFDP